MLSTSRAHSPPLSLSLQVLCTLLTAEPVRLSVGSCVRSAPLSLAVRPSVCLWAPPALCSVLTRLESLETRPTTQLRKQARWRAACLGGPPDDPPPAPAPGFRRAGGSSFDSFPWAGLPASPPLRSLSYAIYRGDQSPRPHPPRLVQVQEFSLSS